MQGAVGDGRAGCEMYGGIYGAVNAGSGFGCRVGLALDLVVDLGWRVGRGRFSVRMWRVVRSDEGGLDFGWGPAICDMCDGAGLLAMWRMHAVGIAD